MEFPNHAPDLTDSAAAADHGASEGSIAAIRRALEQHGHLSSSAATIPADADLYAAGLTSHATVNVMLAVENELDIEFPDALLTRSTFASVDALAGAVAAATR